MTARKARPDVRPDDSRRGWYLSGLVEGWGRGYAAWEAEAVEQWAMMRAAVTDAAAHPDYAQLVELRARLTAEQAQPVPSLHACRRSWEPAGERERGAA